MEINNYLHLLMDVYMFIHCDVHSRCLIGLISYKTYADKKA